MSTAWAAARRVGFAVLAAYLVLSITFGFVALTADPNIAIVQRSAGESAGYSDEDPQEAAEEAVAAYREARNLDDPLYERYVRWLVDVTTLDWGVSYSTGMPVVAALSAHLRYTLAYALPGAVLATAGALALGTLSGGRVGSLLDRVTRSGSYLLFGIPAFWLLETVTILGGQEWVWSDTFVAVGDQLQRAGVWTPGNWRVFALATAGLLVTLLPGQLRYVRSQFSEYRTAEFVTVVRAKGGGQLRVAKHVLRNAALPLLSLFFADLLGALVLNVYVIEYVLDIPGYGWLTLQAIQRRDVPLILGATMVVVLVGIAGNLLQDLAYLVLDPRLDADE